MSYCDSAREALQSDLSHGVVLSRLCSPSVRQHTVTVSSDSQATIQALVPSGLGVWLSFHNLGTVRLFHTLSFEMICEVDVTSAVTRMLSGGIRGCLLPLTYHRRKVATGQPDS